MRAKRLNVRKTKKSAKAVKHGFGALADTVSHNPAIAGGSTAASVALALIFSNALWYQPHKHPSPMFSTRDMTNTNSIRKAPTSAEVELNVSLQRALSDLNYYEGKIDGIFGSRTKLAIEEYQRAANLIVDGKPSKELLRHALLSPPAIGRIPTPRSRESLDGLITESSNSEVTQRDLVAKIQSGLKYYGFPNIQVDGLIGEETEMAIRKFQLDYGMTITGQASESVLGKLREIGAMQKTAENKQG